MWEPPNTGSFLLNFWKENPGARQFHIIQRAEKDFYGPTPAAYTTVDGTYCLLTSQENRKTHPPKGIDHCSDPLGHGHHPLFMHPW